MKEKEFRIIDKSCIVCGRKLKIKLYEDGSYRNGQYFGVLKVPVGRGKDRKIGAARLGNMKCDVFEWTGRKMKAEYWECDECFDEA